MGTSSSYSAPTTPAWRRAKNATSRYASGGGADYDLTPALPVARFVDALGGATEATREAQVGRAVAANFLGFAQDAATRGVGAALVEVGIADAVGLSADEVLQRIVDTLASGTTSLDETAAREALVDLLREMLQDNDDLDEAFGELDADDVFLLLQRFIAAYIFRRFAKALGDRLRARSESGPAARRREEEIRRFILAEVSIAFEDIDAETFDWRADGPNVVDRLMREAFRTLGDQDV